MQQERRKDVRIPLDDLCYAYVTLSSGPTLECILLDVSPCGARVGLPASDNYPYIGENIVLHVDEASLSTFFNQRKGRIVWTRGVQMGIFFEDPVKVTPQDLANSLGLDLIITCK